MKRNRKINVALIGAGGMGKRWAEGLKRAKGVSVRVVCDKDRKRAEEIAKFFPNCRVETALQKVAKAKDVDVALIVLPTTLLAKTSLLFLKNKKHVLCEKPGGTSSSEINKAIIAAQKNKVHYNVGYNHRFHDAFLKARREFERGTIGELMFIRARYGFGGRKGYEKEWRLKKLLGGGELLDQGTHMIDLARWFMGDTQNVKGFVGNLFWSGGAEDNAFFLLKNKKGKIASVHASWSEWRPTHTFEIYGTKGYLIVDGLGRKYKGMDGGNERLIVGKRVSDFTSKEMVIRCDAVANKSLVRELEAFIRAIKNKSMSQTSGLDAFNVLKIVENIYEQNKKKKQK